MLLKSRVGANQKYRFNVSELHASGKIALKVFLRQQIPNTTI